MRLLIFLWRWLRQYLAMLWLTLRLYQSPSYHHYRSPTATTKTAPIRCRAKPHWVRQEVIRLKALMPHDGCRKIADTFNRLHAERRKVTVGKTYVSNVIQQYQYEIRQTRHAIRNRKLKAQPKNRVWGVDLTQVRDTHKQAHTLFGAVDHGTRACLLLRQIPNKTSLILLRALCDVVEHYGKPKAIRTDNEAIFTSQLFRFGLWLLGIKHQRTEKHCPWMNGRVERFFGTFKRMAGNIAFSMNELPQRLAEFRFYYNHIRPHQHLDGRTPAEVWSGKQPNTCGKAVYCQYWSGALAGFYLPPN